MNLKEAKDIAVKLCYQLQPFCEEKRLRIAGSVRRKKLEVKDIEIVALPVCDIAKDLFGTPSHWVRSKGFIDTVNSFGKIIKGKATGKYIQIELPEGITLDLFIPSPEDYFRQLAIRTGSSDYAFKVIATGWKKLGWCGSDKGLRKMNQCIEMKDPNGKSKWKCVKENADLPPIWESEESFLEWLKIPYLSPDKRNL